MSDPRRPRTPSERAARIASRTFPGNAGGFVSSTSPVSSASKQSLRSGQGTSTGIRVFIQSDEPDTATLGDFWLDTDGSCGG